MAVTVEPALSPHLTVDDAAAAIDFYVKAFGAVEVGRVPPSGRQADPRRGPDQRPVDAVPATFNGLLRFNTTNEMFAAAIAWAGILRRVRPGLQPP